MPNAQPSAATAARPSRARRSLSGLRLPDWRRALAPVGRFVPTTRRALAAVAGVALTPAVTLGLVLFTVFSHPTLTPRVLASFVLWKAAELVSAAWTGLAQVVGVDALVRALIDAPFMLAGGALAYSVVSGLALRVLYKNLMSHPRHARVSHS
jgi:hypothetical protein